MKGLIIVISLLAFTFANAQTKDYIGKWELCKIVTAKGDTERIKSNDARYITYNFEYNNTFTSFVKAKDEEATGRWGFDFAAKMIKIKNPVYTKTKTKIGLARPQTTHTKLPQLGYTSKPKRRITDAAR